MRPPQIPLLCALLAFANWADAADSRRKRATSCGQNKFQCNKDGTCIDVVSVCDGNTDCPDGSDENHDACFGILVPAVTNYIASEVLRPPVSCPDGMFQCTTGECIDPKLKCDGKDDCQDGADERLPECPSRPIGCGNNQFRCKSGMCVAASKVCNRIRDCDDSSDESRSLCADVSVPELCTYPKIPENGKYKVVGCESCTPTPGKPTEESTRPLLYTCNHGFELKGESVLFCTGGKWSPEPPICVQRLCPRLTSDSIFAECTHNQTRFTCDWPALPGTKAVLRCKAYYVPTSSPRQSLQCGLDGRWSDVIMKCRPGCGTDRSGNNPLVANGQSAKVGDFPWHTGIYKETEKGPVQICGGSLISQSYVLTAAHCFWDNAREKAYTEDLFKVIAGKYHRSYGTIDPGQQERKVQKIDIPIFFSGPTTYYRQDIAIITVDVPFLINDTVRPVCVDWDNIYIVAPGDRGQVAGWGKTETGALSEDLLFADFPVIEITECIKNTSPNYQNYFGDDKICAGDRNGTALCNGDSGGGLSFIHELNPFGKSTKLYFVHGIVSTSGGVYSGDCNLKDYISFTKVSFFRDFLEKYREY